MTEETKTKIEELQALERDAWEQYNAASELSSRKSAAWRLASSKLMAFLESIQGGDN